MCLYLFTLAVEVDEGVAGRRNVLRCHALVHAIDIEVETTVGIHQQTQHRPLRTRVQIRTIVLTYLGEKKQRKEKERRAGREWNKNERRSVTQPVGTRSVCRVRQKSVPTPSRTTDFVCLPLGSCGRRSLSAAARRSASGNTLWTGSWVGRGSGLSRLTTATTSMMGSDGRSETVKDRLLRDWNGRNQKIVVTGTYFCS